MKTKKMVLCAFFAAVITLTAPFSILIGPVPVTAVLFSLALVSFVSGSRIAMAATLVYIIIGVCGLPVFANFQGGIGVLFSPTGGFLISYVFVVFILGKVKVIKSRKGIILTILFALSVCYLFGTLWYVCLTRVKVWTAFTICVLPFIPFDVIKLLLAYAVAKRAKKTLKITGDINAEK